MVGEAQYGLRLTRECEGTVCHMTDEPDGGLFTA